MNIFSFPVGPLETNLYLLVEEEQGEAVIVDPGEASEEVLSLLEREGWRVSLILNTHAHFDHIGGNAFFQEATGAPIALHPQDLPLYRRVVEQGEFFGVECLPQPEPNLMLWEGQRLALVGRQWEVWHTPGHSPGSVCLYTPGHLLVGDVLFAGSVGRVDLPGGDWGQLARSLARLFTLPPSVKVYPGHGPPTTLARELRTNLFVAMALPPL